MATGPALLEGSFEEEGPVLSAEFLKKFGEAVHSEYSGELLPTLPTIYRNTEFSWLKKLGVDLKDLLHVDQTYEYVEPFRVNERPKMTTRVVRFRERPSASLLFLETQVTVNGRKKAVCSTTFMIRSRA